MRRLTETFLVLSLLISANLGRCATSDFDIIKNRVLQEEMRSRVNDNRVGQLVGTLKEDGTWPGINYEDVSSEGFQHRYHMANMVTMARAYQSKSSEYYHKKNVKNAIELALKNWVDHDYICENWWYNQIYTPENLVSLMLIMGNDLSEELVDKAQPIINRANLNAPGARPGGDRIHIAAIEAKNQLFLGNDKKFEQIIQVIENEIRFTEWIGNKFGYGYRLDPGGFENRNSGGRGIQYDNSFHHRVDGVNNTLSYGLEYAEAFVEWAVFTRGTKYSFSEKKLDQLIDFYLDGICKMAIFGKYPDPGAKNRSISRKGELRPFNAKIAEDLMLVTGYRKNELQEIADIRSKGIKPTLSFATFFWDSEYFSFQRPDFFTSVRMYSKRVYNMEKPYNSEGLLNHHRGDGANHISLTGDEYFNIWPVYDYQMIPGATIMQKPELPSPDEIQKLGETDFVGAVTDGKYGAAAFDFKSPADPLVARKAWFFFDNEYVCLGAGISCTKRDLPVVTTINQCLLRGDVTVSHDNVKSVIPKGENRFENTDWVFQDGVGYAFPEPATVNIRNNEATGSWWRITKQNDTPKNEVKMDVFKIWLDHGKRPSDATYEYIVVPATTVEKMEQNTSKNNIEILSNTPEIQAVKNKALDICQVVFYKAGEIEVGGDFKLVSDNPGIVMLKMDGNKVAAISVSDPNRELYNYNLSVSEKIDNPVPDLDAVWDAKEKMTHITIKLPQRDYSGASTTIDL